MSFLNAVYFGLFISSSTSVSIHSAFPTSISVASFPFSDVSFIAFSGISIFTVPSFVPKFPNTIVYFTPLNTLL